MNNFNPENKIPVVYIFPNTCEAYFKDGEQFFKITDVSNTLYQITNGDILELHKECLYPIIKFSVTISEIKHELKYYRALQHVLIGLNQNGYSKNFRENNLINAEKLCVDDYITISIHNYLLDLYDRGAITKSDIQKGIELAQHMDTFRFFRLLGVFQLLDLNISIIRFK
jgi:hypothetical protein